MRIRSAVLVAPSRSTSVCRGSVRWLLPAAVMIAFLISTACCFRCCIGRCERCRMPIHSQLRDGLGQQFSLWTRLGRRVRAPGLQDGGFVGDVGRVPSPGGDWDSQFMQLCTCAHEYDDLQIPSEVGAGLGAPAHPPHRAWPPSPSLATTPTKHATMRTVSSRPGIRG